MSHVGLVINYELPDTAEALTHRIGRTARNGKTGRALTFVTADDGEKWAKLRRQGAVALRTIDASALASNGDWLYLEGSAHLAAVSSGAGPAGGAQSRRTRRPRSGRGRPGHRTPGRTQSSPETSSPTAM